MWGVCDYRVCDGCMNYRSDTLTFTLHQLPVLTEVKCSLSTVSQPGEKHNNLTSICAVRLCPQLKSIQMAFLECVRNHEQVGNAKQNALAPNTLMQRNTS